MEILTPFDFANLTVPNRVVMPAMCQYSATDDGYATNWHLMHYGSRAVGGVGLIILEATAIEPRGRLSGNDLGIWNDAHVAGLKEVVDCCHEQGSKVGIQIAHAGRKAWGDELVAPSALAFPKKEIPEELSVTDIEKVVLNWQAAAKRANLAGFDVLQIHGAHGYLIHEFLSPLSNQRTDHYGGSFTNRLRFLQEIVRAVQTVWPQEKPLSVRLSATDCLEGGLTVADTVKICQTLKEQGVDLLDISSGGLLPATMKLGPGYQVPFAEVVKREVGLPTIAVGLITEPEMVQEILLNERADFVALGRELLRNPYWVLENTREQEKWPWQYRRAVL